MAEPKITLVIRTLNEAKSIRRTLEAVRHQIRKPDEILVIDSGSTDATVSIARTFDAVRVFTIPRDRFSFGYALNVGCEQARGDLVVSLSAHAHPVDDAWLYYLTRPFKDERVAGVYGRQLPHPHAWPPVQRDYWDAYGVLPRMQTHKDRRADHFFSNTNAAFRRTCWQDHPFDPHLPYSEDRAWARAMLQRGYRICYEPRAAVFHSHNEPLRAIYRRAYHEQMAHQRIYRDAPPMHTIVRDAWRAYRMDVAYILHSPYAPGWILSALFLRCAWMMGRIRAARAAMLMEPGHEP